MSYRPQSIDTDEATERYLFERLAVLPPWRKAEMLSAATRAAYQLAIAGLKERYPTAEAGELRRRFGALTLGRKAAIAMLHWDPEREGW